MDLDDLFESTKAPTRSSRFAPKGSKVKPKTEPVVSSSASSINLSKKEDHLELKPETSINSSQPFVLKNEPEAKALGVDAVAMEVDAKLVERGSPKDEPMEIKEEEDEDAVVREIDVYFNPSIDPNTKLYVLQYPLRPLWRPYELDDRCAEVRLRPQSADIEIDLAFDSNSDNYDSDTKFEMTKQTLTPLGKTPIAAGYAVGVLVGDSLHLNPIHAVLQLRSSMQHFKPEGSKRRSSSSANLEDDPKEEELRDEKRTGPTKKQSKPPGVLNDLNEDAGESWVPLIYHGARSDISGRYVRKMVAQNESPLKFSMSRDDYVNTLCPVKSNENNRSRGPSTRDLHSLPLEERFKTWLLKEPQIHRFDVLKHLAPDAPVEDIFEVLQKHAQLVQGLWVPKSPLFYGTDQGIEVLARDFVLLLFSKTPVIKNSQLPHLPKLNKAMKGVLSVLAFERASLSDWKFKESPDMAFVKLNPKVVAEQGQAWERFEKQITEHVFGGKNRPAVKSSSGVLATNNSTMSKSLSKPLSKSANEQKLLRKPMSEETREALPKALQKLFQIHKVCSFQQICLGLRQMAVSENSRPKGSARELKAAADGVDAPIEELQSIINQVAINIHGVYVSKSSPDYPQYDQFRKVVIDLFTAEGPNAKLKKDYMIEAAKLKLKREISSIEYQKVVQELCVSQSSAWVLKSGDGKPK